MSQEILSKPSHYMFPFLLQYPVVALVRINRTELLHTYKKLQNTKGLSSTDVLSDTTFLYVMYISNSEKGPVLQMCESAANYYKVHSRLFLLEHFYIKADMYQKICLRGVIKNILIRR